MLYQPHSFACYDLLCCSLVSLVAPSSFEYTFGFLIILCQLFQLYFFFLWSVYRWHMLVPEYEFSEWVHVTTHSGTQFLFLYVFVFLYLFLLLFLNFPCLLCHIFLVSIGSFSWLLFCLLDKDKHAFTCFFNVLWNGKISSHGQFQNKEIWKLFRFGFGHGQI